MTERLIWSDLRERSNFILLNMEILFEDHLLRKLKFFQNKRKTVWSFLMQYSSHWPQHVKCSSCKLRYAISVNHTLDFKYLMWKKNVEYLSNFYTAYMLKWYCLGCVCVCVCVQLFSHLQLCNPMDYSPLVSSVHGIFQARILEWVAISFSRGSSQPRNQTCVSCIGRQVLYLGSPWIKSKYFKLISPVLLYFLMWLLKKIKIKMWLVLHLLVPCIILSRIIMELFPSQHLRVLSCCCCC